jgi:membrane associated rhomboid family serine protease
MSQFRFSRPDLFPPVVKNLIIINVLVFLLQQIFDHSFEPLTTKLLLWPVVLPNFQLYQLFTNMFAHADFGHLFFNMLGLWMAGRMLENIWGQKRFLLFYLACGFGASVFHVLIQYIRFKYFEHSYLAGANINVADVYSVLGPVLGASGAIMGCFAAIGYLFPNTMVELFPIPRPLKLKWVVIGFILIDLVSEVGRFEGDTIAHIAHLGGALTGFLIVKFWNKTNKKTFY